jgi:cytochrome P450
MRTQETPAPHYDPFDYEHHDDPYADYRRLRDHAPVFYNSKFDFFALSRYDDCLHAVRDFRTYSSAAGSNLEDTRLEVAIILNSDPPVHTRLRHIVVNLFTPDAVAPLEKEVKRMAIDLLRPHAGKGHIDIIKDFAARLPMAIICQMLGFPREDEDMLREWTDAAVHREPDKFEVPESGMDAMGKLFAYFQADLSRRATQPPRNDVVGALLAAEGADRLSHDELLGFMLILSIAGNETTTKLIGNMIFQLHRNPEQRNRLLTNRSLLKSAIEETMRFDGPTQMMARTTTRDVILHDTVIPAGKKVALIFTSANRDDRKYENAETFDISRNPRDHLGFGGGLHSCVGAALARLEARVAMEELLTMMPDFVVDETRLDRMHSPNVRGFTTVPVSFTPNPGYPSDQGRN